MRNTFTTSRSFRIAIAVLTGLLASWIILWSGAAKAQIKGIVVDEVDALTSSEEAAITQRLTELSTELNVQFVVYMVSTPGNATIAEFAEEWYNERELGIGTYRDGVMLTVAIDSRETDIFLQGMPYKTIDRDSVVEATDKARPHFAQQQWANGVNAYIDIIGPAVRDGLNSVIFYGRTPLELGLSLGVGVLVGGTASVSGEAVARRRMANIGIEKKAGEYILPGTAILQRDDEELISRSVNVYDISKESRDDSSSSSGSSRGTWSSSSSNSGHYSSRF